jgi:hypothetical protein
MKKPKIKRSKYGGYEIEGIFGRYATHRDALYRVELIPIIEAKHAWNMEKWKKRLAAGQSLIEPEEEFEEDYFYTSPF